MSEGDRFMFLVFFPETKGEHFLQNLQKKKKKKMPTPFIYKNCFN